jgi:hypothetical protein
LRRFASEFLQKFINHLPGEPWKGLDKEPVKKVFQSPEWSKANPYCVWNPLTWKEFNLSVDKVTAEKLGNQFKEYFIKDLEKINVYASWEENSGAVLVNKICNISKQELEEARNLSLTAFSKGLEQDKAYEIASDSK